MINDTFVCSYHTLSYEKTDAILPAQNTSWIAAKNFWDYPKNQLFRLALSFSLGKGVLEHDTFVCSYQATSSLEKGFSEKDKQI